MKIYGLLIIIKNNSNKCETMFTRYGRWDMRNGMDYNFIMNFMAFTEHKAKV
jgi:LAS superfamily LD-carboxypeptidase LdcB